MSANPYGDALWRRSRALHRLEYLDPVAARAWGLANVGPRTSNATAEQLVDAVNAQALELEILVAVATAKKTN